MSLADLEPCAERAWASTVAKAAGGDRVARHFGTTIAAWRLRGAYPTDETYLVSGSATRPRIALSLGEPLPVLAEYQVNPSLRHGLAVVEVNVDPLPKIIKPGADSDDLGDGGDGVEVAAGGRPRLKVRYRGRGGCRLHWSTCWRLNTIRPTDVDDLRPDPSWANFDLSQLVICTDCGSTVADFQDAVAGRTLRDPRPSR